MEPKGGEDNLSYRHYAPWRGRGASWHNPRGPHPPRMPAQGGAPGAQRAAGDRDLAITTNPSAPFPTSSGLEQDARGEHRKGHDHTSLGEIAIGVVIGRTS